MKRYDDSVSPFLSDELPSERIAKITERENTEQENTESRGTDHENTAHKSAKTRASEPTPLDSTQLTLVKVRPLTNSPQLSLGDLKVCRTAYGLEIQCSQRRIRERLLAPVAKRAIARNSPKKASSSEDIAITILAIVATVVFVGGAIAITGSVLFATFIAALLPLIFWAIVGDHEPKRYGQAIVRISKAPNGRKVLTLKTTPASQNEVQAKYNRIARSRNIAVKSTVHCTNLPVGTIQASFNIFQLRRLSELRLVFAEGNHFRGHKQLRITGTRAEIQWLRAHLSSRGSTLRAKRGS